MLILLMEWLYEVRRCNGLQLHNTPTKLHEDWFRHSSNIKDNFVALHPVCGA
jgi:hypothetical protein